MIYKDLHEISRGVKFSRRFIFAILDFVRLVFTWIHYGGFNF